MVADANPDQDDREAVADLLFRMGAAFDGFTSQMRRAFSLNAHERLAISTLWSRGPQTMTELGTWIPLSRAAVTTLVDRLEDAGLVRRGSDGSDRRRTVVHVTDAALDRMRPVLRPWGRGLEEIVARRTPEEWDTIASFLGEFVTLNRRETEILAELSDTQIKALAVDSQQGSEVTR
ncbi:MAG: MarR family transcriptional regulator [Thermoleophilia bacterium]|nr:MarR family transcriptional regulator [Thermoleophilia bacterium]